MASRQIVAAPGPLRWLAPGPGHIVGPGRFTVPLLGTAVDPLAWLVFIVGVVGLIGLGLVAFLYWSPWFGPSMPLAGGASVCDPELNPADAIWRNNKAGVNLPDGPFTEATAGGGSGCRCPVAGIGCRSRRHRWFGRGTGTRDGRNQMPRISSDAPGRWFQAPPVRSRSARSSQRPRRGPGPARRHGERQRLSTGKLGEPMAAVRPRPPGHGGFQLR